MTKSGIFDRPVHVRDRGKVRKLIAAGMIHRLILDPSIGKVHCLAAAWLLLDLRREVSIPL